METWKKEGIKNIIISSPDENLIFLIYNKIKRIRTPIHLGAMHFHIINSKFFRTNISYPLVITSITPIIVRIPQNVYQDYSLNLKYPYEYVFWRQCYPLELFLGQLETNLKRKFVNYYGHTVESPLSFSKFVFERQVSRKVIIRGMTSRSL